MSQIRVALITSRPELAFWLNQWVAHPLPGVDVVSVISHNAFMSSSSLPVRMVKDEDFASADAFESVLLEEWMPRRVDYVISWECDRVLSPRVLEVFPQKVLNVHPSLFPSSKASAEEIYKSLLQSRPNESGVTLHEVEKNGNNGMGAGKRIAQKKFPFAADESLFSLQEKTRKAGMELILDFFLEKGKPKTDNE